MRNIYITDNGNACIRKIDGSGNIETIAGSDIVGYSGDGGPATDAELDNPGGIVADNYGNVFVADFGNNVIRKVYNIPLINRTVTLNSDHIAVYPNPANDVINVDIKNVNSGKVSIQLSDVTGKELQAKTFDNTESFSTFFDIRALPAAAYFVTVKTGTQEYVSKAVKE